MHIQVCCTHLNYCIVRPNSCTSRTYPIETSKSYMTHGYFFIVFLPQVFLFFHECVPFFTEFFIFLKKKTGIFIDFCFQLFGSGWMFEGFPFQAPPRPAPRMVCWRPCNLQATAAPRPATPHWARDQHWWDAPRRCLGHGISGSQGGSHGFPMVFPWFSPKS